MSRAGSAAAATAATAGLLAACTAAQSARTLAPGKTQLTVGVAHMSESGFDDTDDSFWAGTLMLRHGLARSVDGGLFLERTPGAGGFTAAGIEPKVQLTGAGRGTVSLSLAGGVLFSDEVAFDGGGLQGDFDGYLLVPTIFVGYDLTPTAELVIAPKLFLLFPDDGDSDHEVGGSIGLRLTDPARTWAIHPELAIVTTDANDILTLGVSIGAGN